ncbi:MULTISPECIES: hypothetical protein [Spongiibacter]|uniref:hypothetical protein n=1 Tax=Spongiibacter TaxID=630749 RepID=UPI000C403C21|nr:MULTISPECIES: hypothetical protein [Spongiibacter]MAY39134.1 hypothetical protein [Spongiibacter sp.]MBI57461.1 hypothetical protein [Spongiibacter sp.]MBO6752833.1 hypothetical protein [Spongiibacter sp.]|tara:strand:+ start:38533 stop:39204 length:672 start_codon:yes stop_codon:yes gene_type:complete
MKNVLAIATALTLSSSLLIAGPVNNENITTFTAGSPAVAADVNSTIQALVSAINDNASRIAALEDSAPDNSVAGNSYQLRSINSMVAVGDTESYSSAGPNDFANISNGTLSATLTFDSTGSNGTLTIDAGNDESYEVNVPTNKLENFTDDASDNSTFTFTQTGNTVSATFDEGGDEFFTLEFLVSADGSLLVTATSDVGSTTFNDGSNGEEAFVELVIGVRSQ